MSQAQSASGMINNDDMDLLDKKSEKDASWTCTVLTSIYMVLVDVCVYGSLIPLSGTYLAGIIVKWGGFSPCVELVLTVSFTFFLVYLAFQLCGESSYWKHLFAFEKMYFRLLQVRDILNMLALGTALVCLLHTVEQMVADKGMKKDYINEGTGYFFVKRVSSWFGMEQEMTSYLNMKLPHAGSLSDPNFGENEKFERGGALMLFWAMLSIAKLLYFNTLFTYLRAMEIFMSLKPTFNDEDDYDDYDSRSMIMSSSMICKADHPSQLESDLTRAARNNAMYDDRNG